MVEYTYDEAVALLEGNLETALEKKVRKKSVSVVAVSSMLLPRCSQGAPASLLPLVNEGDSWLILECVYMIHCVYITLAAYNLASTGTVFCFFFFLCFLGGLSVMGEGVMDVYRC